MTSPSRESAKCPSNGPGFGIDAKTPDAPERPGSVQLRHAAPASRRSSRLPSCIERVRRSAPLDSATPLPIYARPILGTLAPSVSRLR